jgi:hypothetical protein
MVGELEMELRGGSETKGCERRVYCSMCESGLRVGG